MLFDEIEKAHPNIYNLLLQIFDDGKITDSLGREISFKNTICIMTSNVGSNKLLTKSEFGFVDGNALQKEYEGFKRDVNKELERSFSLEFLNRIDDIIVFNKLAKANIKEISKLLLDELRIKLRKQRINVSFTNNVLDYIVDIDFNDKYGARQLKRLIKSNIEPAIADYIIENNPNKNLKIIVDYVGNKIVTSKINIQDKDIKRVNKEKELA